MSIGINVCKDCIKKDVCIYSEMVLDLGPELLKITDSKKLPVKISLDCDKKYKEAVHWTKDPQI